ncbi:cell envelope biogenesis protein OmpA [Marinifilum breve]|uniref:Cell envelope biogenesis protein OmpA n=1 Tax=Marinifilum breve TaxID=2184082 RepID=A0A2V4A0L9_9BACT|nr:OmpA family protein [Marinifilum breve]PXY02425.1 cell envelope biogenesis protein OmpA [Marinifilum breve]
MALDNNNNEESQWIHISDLMSVLMMVFLFIAISYMFVVKKQFNKIKEIAVTYNKLQDDLYDKLHEEFKNDLEKWNAEIDSTTISVKFKSPEVLFGAGQAQLKPEFKEILSDFIPRYLKIITDTTYINDIEEIKIEGHTSSEGKAGMNKDESYIYNMNLSQRRAFSTFNYIYSNLTPNIQKDWVMKHLTATGLSFSRIKLDSSGIENRSQSRRVEFRIKTNAEQRMVKILNQ